MKKVLEKRSATFPAALVLLLVFVLNACSGPSYRVVAEMDWPDIVVTPDALYMALDNGVLRDPDTVTEEIAFTVEQKLYDHIEDPGYRAKPGDAAFLDKGTKLYRVNGFDPQDLMAAPSDQHIGGYRLYAREGFDALPSQDLDRILQDRPASMDVYPAGSPDPLRETSGAEAAEFAGLLSSPVRETNGGNGSGKTPIDYQIVPDNGEPILYAFWLADDGAVRLKEGWVLNGAIRKFLSP